MRILVAEDDPKTARIVRTALTEEGYTVDTADTGDAAVKSAGDYDLLLLDVMLPGRDGWAVLKELRTNGVTTPVIFLTARDAVDDRVKGLDLGADDYLVKPFAVGELAARVRTVLRRGTGRPTETLKIADFELDLIRQTATRGGATLDLTPTEFSLLAVLARRAGTALSRGTLAEQVWGLGFDPGSNVIDVNVRRLRAKADDPFPVKRIRTVRGVGYALDAGP